MRIAGLDHLVPAVASIERSCACYERVFGMGRETFAGGRNALAFGNPIELSQYR